MAGADPDINQLGRSVFLWTAGGALAFAAIAYVLVTW
jgi:hypothetical protein